MATAIEGVIDKAGEAKAWVVEKAEARAAAKAAAKAKAEAEALADFARRARAVQALSMRSGRGQPSRCFPTISMNNTPSWCPRAVTVHKSIQDFNMNSKPRRAPLLERKSRSLSLTRSSMISSA